MRKLLVILLCLGSLLSDAQGPNLTPYTRKGNTFNEANALLKLNDSGRIDIALLPSNLSTGTTSIDTTVYATWKRLYKALDSLKGTLPPGGSGVDTTSVATRAWVQKGDDVLSATKQNRITLTTNGNSGAAVFNWETGQLNIPQYDISGSTTTGDIVTNSFAAKGITTSGDQTNTIQSVYNAGARVLLANAASASDFIVNGTLEVPGLHIYFTHGNRLINQSQSGTGTLTVSNLDSIYVPEGGSGTGYSSAPAVTISGGLGATAVAEVSGGKVVKVTITRGAWFSSTPTISFSGGGGSGATATAKVLDFGRFINGTGTAFYSQIKADYSIYVGGVKIGDVDNVRSDTYLKLRSPSPLASSAAAFTYFGGVLRGAVVHADLSQTIFNETFTFDGRTANDASSIAWYGANGYDNNADNIPTQKALDDACRFRKIPTVYAPVGSYFFDKGVFLRSGDNDSQFPFNQVNFIGLGSFYDANMGGGVRFELRSQTGFAVGVQRGKGNRIGNFEISGQNHFSYDFDELRSDTSKFYVPGIDTSHNAPYQGFVIDPFGFPTIAMANRPKGFEHLCNQTSNAGSTKVNYFNMKIDKFLVNFSISPTGTMQNGESCAGSNLYSNHSLVAYGNYNSQAVVNTLDGYEVWTQTKIALDCARNDGSGMAKNAGYGQGGQMFENRNGNLAGGVVNICRVGDNYGTHRFGHIRAELTNAIGGVLGDGSFGSTTLIFNELDWRPMGINAEGSTAPAAVFIAKAQHITLRDSRIVNYGQPGAPLSFIATDLYFDNTELPQVGLGYVPDSTWHQATNFGGTFRVNGVGRLDKYTTSIAAMSNITVQGVNAAAGTWAFDASSSASAINVGDKIYIYSTAYVNEYDGEDRIIPIGFVKSKSGNIITVEHLAYGIYNGPLLNTVYVNRIP